MPLEPVSHAVPARVQRKMDAIKVQLGSEDRSTRADALRSLKDVPHPETVGLLMAGLKGPNVTVEIAARETIHAIVATPKHPLRGQAIDALGSILKRPLSSEVPFAVNTLAMAGTPRAFQALADAFPHLDATMRDWLLERVKTSPHASGKHAIAVWRQAIQDNRNATLAADQLAFHPHEDALLALARHTAHVQEKVRNIMHARFDAERSPAAIGAYITAANEWADDKRLTIHSKQNCLRYWNAALAAFERYRQSDQTHERHHRHVQAFELIRPFCTHVDAKGQHWLNVEILSQAFHAIRNKSFNPNAPAALRAVFGAFKRTPNGVFTEPQQVVSAAVAAAVNASNRRRLQRGGTRLFLQQLRDAHARGLNKR